MRLEPVNIHHHDKPNDLMEYYMGANTSERQAFIINNLVIEEDRREDLVALDA